MLDKIIVFVIVLLALWVRDDVINCFTRALGS